MSKDMLQIDWDKSQGLVPAIVQHALTGKVLMLGYMNREALAATEDSRQVTFFSRSRQRLWTKGETSGNLLAVDRIDLDCDRDTLLISATPAGPTCHLGRSSCFDTDKESPGPGFLGELENVIDSRVASGSEDSYTRQLVAAGIERIAKKVGEEGVEVALAGACGTADEVLEESADLIFHLLLLLRERDLSLEDVTATLKQRHRTASE
jgi:phosphoribosyl-ATP pyrophosphohydrolase/phosphoribosyl-AMP cyclohydrolase